MNIIRASLQVLLNLKVLVCLAPTSPLNPQDPLSQQDPLTPAFFNVLDVAFACLLTFYLLFLIPEMLSPQHFTITVILKCRNG